ncbi:hypothetical protein [Clostridium sp.]|uniref:hypothetical protein n=1 Tax=Clostridium sp. TaxID=1506 RepID=UPI003D6D81D3
MNLNPNQNYSKKGNYEGKEENDATSTAKCGCGSQTIILLLLFDGSKEKTI